MIRVLRPGLQSTLQAGPRLSGYGFGVTPGGAADERAMALTRAMLRQGPEAAVLEIVRSDVGFEVLAETVVALGGGGIAWSLGDGIPLANWAVHHLPAGSLLAGRHTEGGFRGYLAVHGGFEAESFLDARGTDLRLGRGGSRGPLRPGQVLKPVSSAEAPGSGEATGNPPGRWRISAALTDYLSYDRVRMFEAPETALLGDAVRTQFTAAVWTVRPDSDRMGIRLDGPPLPPREEISMISTSVLPGTVQITPGGPIVLFVDAQTTGGYPRLGQVCRVDLPVLAQKGPGDPLRFEWIPFEEAGALLEQWEADLRRLRSAIALQGTS